MMLLLKHCCITSISFLFPKRSHEDSRPSRLQGIFQVEETGRHTVLVVHGFTIIGLSQKGVNYLQIQMKMKAKGLNPDLLE